MEVIIKAVEEIMNGLSDGISQERILRETMELKNEDRLEKLEEKVKELDDVTDSLSTVRIRNRLTELVKGSVSRGLRWVLLYINGKLSLRPIIASKKILSLL